VVYRKQPINIGILFKENVLFSSDPDLRPVLDLAKFSISFASNLLRDSQLVEIVHKPISSLQHESQDGLQDDGAAEVILREHVLFKFLTNQAGETLAICATYPSEEDLKVLDIASLTSNQLVAQEKAFIDTIARRFTELVDLDSLSQLRPDLQDFDSMSRLLQLHQLMNEFHREILQASQVIFKDDHADVESVASHPMRACAFLFASVMHGSVPCASRFFKNLGGFFKMKISAGSQNADSIIENLISAQLSTIVTTALSLAKTMIRQVDLQINDSVSAESLHITFYPVKNEYTIVFIAKGDPTALRYFTETTARNLANVQVLDERFTGNMEYFEPIVQFLNTLPPVFELDPTSEDYTELDQLDLELEVLALDSEGKIPRNDEEGGNREKKHRDFGTEDIQFLKFTSKLLELLSDTNHAISQAQFDSAAKAAKLLCLLSIKIGNKVLAYYFENKFNSVNQLAANS